MHGRSLFSFLPVSGLAVVPLGARAIPHPFAFLFRFVVFLGRMGDLYRCRGGVFVQARLFDVCQMRQICRYCLS